MPMSWPALFRTRRELFPGATHKHPRIDLAPELFAGYAVDPIGDKEGVWDCTSALVDTIRLSSGEHLDVYRNNIKCTRYSLPSICPHAEPKLPLELHPPGDLLAEIECHFRELGLIGSDESLHWVGHQARPQTRCRCELAPAWFFRPRPPEWGTLRELRNALVSMTKRVGPYITGARTGHVLPTQERSTFDALAERVYGLTQALNIPLPPVVTNPRAFQSRPHGPAALPVCGSAAELIVSRADGEQWLSNWRAVRVGVEARLAQLDRVAQLGIGPEDVDTRDHPLEAPAGTPAHLRGAYEAVAQALFDVAEFRRDPPWGAGAFRETARTLAQCIGAANQRYLEVESQLQAVTDTQGCAHHEALAAIRRVNDAIGHVVLRIVPEHAAVTHLQLVPAPDVAGLVRRMRQQVSRAVHMLRTVAVPELGNTAYVWPAERTLVPAGVLGELNAAGSNSVAGELSINEAELKILRELKTQHPLLLKNVDLEVATDLSKQTVGHAVIALVEKGLAARPNGGRKGVAITPGGIALLGRVRKSSLDHP
ncbi:unnamed protein product [Gemmata massiliana]|uniref:Uncharacterized protein n=1 Tax=Gemmata massiliana TaxID=1210884 RepID=A0A6P2DK29_9BACT|nr:hypothetical protein [Gemmata massiliana]VTS01857.1 unnamed protein product [Gemmata massiliana]